MGVLKGIPHGSATRKLPYYFRGYHESQMSAVIGIQVIAYVGGVLFLVFAGVTLIEIVK